MNTLSQDRTAPRQAEKGPGSPSGLGGPLLQPLGGPYKAVLLEVLFVLGASP